MYENLLTKIDDGAAESAVQDQTVHICRLITELALHYLQNKSMLNHTYPVVYL